MYLYCPVCKEKYTIESGLLRCPNSSQQSVHQLYRNINFSEINKDEIISRWKEGKLSFLVFKEFMGSWHLAKEHGLEKWWEERVTEISNNCEKLAGTGFVRTPYTVPDELAEAIGMEKDCLHVKNETVQLMGSHKSRHLAGAIMHLEALRKTAEEDEEKKNLAIFSCGNAALGASAIAGAAGYTLYTFVPDHIEETVSSLLTNLGAYVVKVSREGSVGEGDPCNNRYRESLETFSWVPFTSYGFDIWSSVEGAEPVGYEFFTDMHLNSTTPDAMIVQIGGGGLAHAVISSARNMQKAGFIEKLPRFYTCQTTSCYPLARAYFDVLKLLVKNGAVKVSPELESALKGDEKEITAKHSAELQKIAFDIAGTFSDEDSPIRKTLRHVAENRGEFFKPWDGGVPESIAEGILDDTTYDGLEVVTGMYETAGLPVIADEDTLDKAHKLAGKHTDTDISATGSAGLAALLLLLERKAIKANEKTAILFTGVGERKTDKPVKEENIIALSRSDSIHKLVS